MVKPVVDLLAVPADQFPPTLQGERLTVRSE